MAINQSACPQKTLEGAGEKVYLTSLGNRYDPKKHLDFGKILGLESLTKY